MFPGRRLRLRVRPGDPRLEGQGVARDRLETPQVPFESEGAGELVVGHRSQQDVRGDVPSRSLSRRAPREPALPDADGGGGAGAVDGRGGALGRQVHFFVPAGHLFFTTVLLISSM